MAAEAGLVDEISRRDAWSARVNAGATRGGRSVSVVGNDGVRYYYSHLSALEPGIAPGVQVATGQRLGAVGNTGSARPTPTCNSGCPVRARQASGGCGAARSPPPDS